MALQIEFKPLAFEGIVECASSRKEDGWRFVQMLCVNTEDGTDLQYSFMKGNVLENYTVPAVKKGTVVPSITSHYISAFVFENEAHDLFGIDIEGNLLDFGGKFYQVAESEPMTVISPDQKKAREKAAQVAAAKAAKAAQGSSGAKAEKAGAAEEKLKDLDPEKAAKVKAAMEAKAAREAAKAASAPKEPEAKAGETSVQAPSTEEAAAAKAAAAVEEASAIDEKEGE